MIGFEQVEVAWNDADDPLKGFSYLYLTESNYNTVRDVVDVDTVVEVDGERRYPLQGILGRKSGLGVENLQGSGAIAGRNLEFGDGIADALTHLHFQARHLEQILVPSRSLMYRHVLWALALIWFDLANVSFRFALPPSPSLSLSMSIPIPITIFMYAETLGTVVADRICSVE